MKFQLSAATRPTAIERRKKKPRDVVIEGINHQIAAIKAKQNDEDYYVERQRYVSDGSGETQKRIVKSRPRPWWWVDDGSFFTEVRYGPSYRIEVVPGKPSFICGDSLDDVIGVFEQVKEAIHKGELDDAIAVARSKASRLK